MDPKQYLASLFGFDGQIAVVIGGTGVLGGALCDGLAQAGATVVVPMDGFHLARSVIAAARALI